MVPRFCVAIKQNAFIQAPFETGDSELEVNPLVPSVVVSGRAPLPRHTREAECTADQ